MCMHIHTQVPVEEHDTTHVVHTHVYTLICKHTLGHAYMHTHARTHTHMHTGQQTDLNHMKAGFHTSTLYLSHKANTSKPTKDLANVFDCYVQAFELTVVSEWLCVRTCNTPSTTEIVLPPFSGTPADFCQIEKSTIAFNRLQRSECQSLKSVTV